MKVFSAFLCLLLALGCAVAVQAADTLDIWVIDVEGGKALIIKNPSGQAMMIDGGMPDMPARAGAPPQQKDRDLNRVAAAAAEAGVKEFDVYLITHYDVDHVGNVPAIYNRFPAKLLVDHGPLLPNPKLAQVNRNAADAYVAFLPGKKRLSVKPGDVLPFKDVKVTVLTSNEEVIQKALPGGGKPNSFCPATLPEPTRGDDNAASIGTLWEFGKFRMADFADALQWVEMKLMCPNNPVGTVDLLMGSHHGMPASSSPALVHALAPKVIITNNGERKGIAPEVVKTMRSSPGIQDIWQLHYSATAGPDNNAPEQFLANMKQQDCQGFSIKVSAKRDGSFTVTNMRNNFSKTYTK
jgi:beta-lactamase superfamily II metal-dependent hydrolase